jgi:hypothetical protein
LGKPSKFWQLIYAYPISWDKAKKITLSKFPEHKSNYIVVVRDGCPSVYTQANRPLAFAK